MSATHAHSNSISSQRDTAAMHSSETQQGPPSNDSAGGVAFTHVLAVVAWQWYATHLKRQGVDDGGREQRR